MEEEEQHSGCSTVNALRIDLGGTTARVAVMKRSRQEQRQYGIEWGIATAFGVSSSEKWPILYVALSLSYSRILFIVARVSWSHNIRQVPLTTARQPTSAVPQTPTSSELHITSRERMFQTCLVRHTHGEQRKADQQP